VITSTGGKEKKSTLPHFFFLLLDGSSSVLELPKWIPDHIRAKVFLKSTLLYGLSEN